MTVPPVADVLGLLSASIGAKVATYGEASDAPVRVLSYRRDFRFLWSFWVRTSQPDPPGEAGEAFERGPLLRWIETGEERTIILVWDGQPESAEPTINITDRVTALDWLVALSQIIGAGARVRVLLLDLESHAHPASFSCQVFPTLVQFLPWVRVYRPYVPGEAELFSLAAHSQDLTRLLSSPSTQLGGLCLLADLGLGSSPVSRPEFTLPSSPTFAAAARRLRDLWSNELTRPEGRHEVSNLVAPLRLAHELHHAKWAGAPALLARLAGDDLRFALTSLLQALGLVDPPTTERSRASSTPPRNPLHDAAVVSDVFGGFGAGVRFLLVDDQVQLGYHDVLTCFLFGDASTSRHESGRLRSGREPHSLQSIATPDHLVDWLCRAVGTSKESACACDGLPKRDPLPPGQPRLLGRTLQRTPGDDEFDVVLLDLRFFREDEPGRSSERRFLQALLDFYHRTGTCRLDDTMLQRAAAAATAFATSQPDGTIAGRPEEIERLVLLPLLLSVVDASLPIVLFSSSQQRRVVEALGDRPNIVTTFAKPLVSGYTAQSGYHEHIAALCEAVQHALRLHEERVVWRRLVTLDWKSPLPDIEAINPATLGRGPGSPPPTTIRYSPKPSLAGAALREQLAGQYIHYIEDQRYFDFMTVPWEMVEGCLTPQELLDDQAVSNTRFALTGAPRSSAAEALAVVRHKKAHGHARSPNHSSDVEDYRLAAILLFLFQLDFIEGSATAPPPSIPSSRDFLGYLRARYPHVRAAPDYRIWPRRLTSDTTVRWADFVAYAVICAAEAAVDGATLCLSSEVARAVDTIAAQRLSAFWRNYDWSAIDGVQKSRAELRGTVMWEERKRGDVLGYVVDMGTFEGWLPSEDVIWNHRGGEACSVAVSNVNRASGSVVLRELNTRLWLQMDRKADELTVRSWCRPEPSQVDPRTSAAGYPYAVLSFDSHAYARAALADLEKQARSLKIKAKWATPPRQRP